MSDETNEHIASRLAHLGELKEMGVDPFGSPFETDAQAVDLLRNFGAKTKEELSDSPVECRIAGRLVALRDFGKASFCQVQDSTGKIQCYFKKDALGDGYKIFKKLDVGDIIGVIGKLFRTKTDELTVEVNDFKLLTKSLRPLPEKWHGLKDIEIRYRQRYVDLIVNPDVREAFTKRSVIIKSIRGFLESRDFIEVETPMMHPIPGGAAARPFKTHHNALDLDLFLRIAPELYLKRLLVGGYERVFEINKNFRNEGISIKHNPEFTMLEFYIAYKDYNYLMDLTEEMFSFVAKQALGVLKFPYGDHEIDFTPSWPRIPILEALRQKGVPVEMFSDLNKSIAWARVEGMDVPNGSSIANVIDKIFGEKVEPGLIQPTFITEYPVELSPLAKRNAVRPEIVDRFELFIAGREIANAFTELNDPIDQKGRFLSQVEAKEKGDDEAHEMDEDFIRALEYGMPPAAGEGIGIDRLVMLLTNSQSIRDVILFPQLKPEK